MEFDKNKVYTALNADEVKIGSKGYFADSLSILKDFIEINDTPKTVREIEDESYEHRFVDEYGTRYGFFYLIEEPKEKKFRPYKDTDEMIADFKKRFNTNVPPYGMPLVWVKRKDRNSVAYVSVYTDSDLLVGSASRTLEQFFCYYTYLDGSPCGIKE